MEHYILLQKYRYEDKIELICQVPCELRNCRMPNILLQPIVENSIFHGILAKEGRGTIRITARRSGNDLYVKVVDDGAGNVKNRIIYIYGEQYGMEMKSTIGTGTTVTLHIPFEK